MWSKYIVHEIDIRVKDPQNLKLSPIGLPGGGDFMTIETGSTHSVFGFRRHAWKWHPVSETTYAERVSDWPAIQCDGSDGLPAIPFLRARSTGLQVRLGTQSMEDLSHLTPSSKASQLSQLQNRPVRANTIEDLRSSDAKTKRRGNSVGDHVGFDREGTRESGGRQRKHTLFDDLAMAPRPRLETSNLRRTNTISGVRITADSQAHSDEGRMGDDNDETGIETPVLVPIEPQVGLINSPVSCCCGISKWMSSRKANSTTPSDSEPVTGA